MSIPCLFYKRQLEKEPLEKEKDQKLEKGTTGNVQEKYEKHDFDKAETAEDTDCKQECIEKDETNAHHSKSRYRPTSYFNIM